MEPIDRPETSVDTNLREVQISFTQRRNPEIIYAQVTVCDVIALDRRRY